MKVCIVLMCILGLSFQAMDTGYPAGLMADCPGMNHTTTLSEETKSSASIVVVYPSSIPLFPNNEVRCTLSDAACVVKHINLRDKVTQESGAVIINVSKSGKLSYIFGKVISDGIKWVPRGLKYVTDEAGQVLIGGYLDSSFSPLLRLFVSQYVAMDRNVLVLEIFPILIRSYPLAARITKPLGKLLGQFLASLTHMGLEASRLELLGGSLGAHIASYAADEFYRLTGRIPSRLTGLDPAGPCFRNLPTKARIHTGAAERVDILHTNIDGFGLADPVGHVDFYANGGEFQPNIKDDFILPCFPLCSHIRAGLYYLSAITNPDQFLAVRCKSVADVRHGNCYEGEKTTNELGPRTDFNRSGIFYLPTDAMPPFYLGRRGLKPQKYGANNYLLKPSPDADIIL